MISSWTATATNTGFESGMRKPACFAAGGFSKGIKCVWIEIKQTRVGVQFIAGYLTVKDLQMALRIGKSTAYKLIQGGEIQHFCIGKSIRIYKQSVVAYLNRALYNNGNVSNSSVPTKEDNV